MRRRAKVTIGGPVDSPGDGNVLKNLTLLAASLVVCLMGVEIALRVLDVYPPLPYPPVPRWPEIYAPHPVYGYALHPTHTVTYDYPPGAPRTLTVHSNADGFRQVGELDHADGRLQVFVTGDSYTFGQGVEEAERFSDRIQQARPGVRVHNIGMTGWGPDLMLLAVEEVLRKTRPDVVVVAISYDDFRRVRPRYAGLGFPIPRFSLVGGELVLGPYPRPSLIERLHLHQALERALRGGNRLLSGPTDVEWRINERILARFRELGATHGFDTVLVYLPGPWKGPVNDRRRTWLRAQGERNGFAVVDVSEAIHSDSARTFLPGDSHYSPAGHQVVADALLPALDSLIGRPAAP